MGQEEQEEPVYVVDENQKNATPAGMISRTKLAHPGAPAPDREDGIGDNRVVFLAVGGLIFVLILGAIGLAFNGAEKSIAEIDAQIEAQKAQAPKGPEEVQGVKVRRGLQHEPNQPAKLPTAPGMEGVDDGVEEVPDNAVPDGDRPADDPAEPAADAVPAPE